MLSRCTFNIAWIGPCGCECIERDRCSEHADLKCVSCGEPATRSCNATHGPCLCSAPLCSNCEHELAPNGTNEGNRHVRKGTQKYKVWIEQTEQEQLQGEYLMLQRKVDSYRGVARHLPEGTRDDYLCPRVRGCFEKMAVMEKEHPELVGLREV